MDPVTAVANTVGSVASFAKGLIDRFWPPDATPEQKIQAQIAMEQFVKERDITLLQAQQAIMVAEMDQSDVFTKRARPMVVYTGLAAIMIVNVLFPIYSFITKGAVPSITLPEEFWWAWTGVCGAWVIGRSAEKKGVNNKLVDLITKWPAKN